MRKLFMAILALAGAWSLLVPVRVYAQQGDPVQEMRPDWKSVTRAARLRTAIDPGDGDTVWVGHVYDPTWSAGGKMPAGGYGPYKVGRGPNFPKRAGFPVTMGDNGTWDFDRFQADEADSLQGWWPLARPYQAGLTTFGDYGRAFFGLDYGNSVNYVINQGSPKRTFGVVGLWHRDRGNITYAPSDTIAGHNVKNVVWSPTEVGGLGSTASAWMGIRCEGDLSHRDEVSLGGTGNYFNGEVIQYEGNNGFNFVGSRGTSGTDHNFPGYGSQMDQMLYRDIDLTGVTGLNISFNYSTNMSNQKNTTPGQEIGWFDKDPISDAHTGLNPTATATSDGNFISATLAAGGSTGAPVDSFMVYIGAPVNDANVNFSAPLFVGINQITTVYDPKRRWFSEVLRCTGGDVHYREVLSVAGVNTNTPVSINVGSLYAAALADIKAVSGNKVRIVFRVKTNRGFDDQNGTGVAPFTVGFNSGTRGAAIVDNVVTDGKVDADNNGGTPTTTWTAADGNFEASGSIDNSKDALAAWRSTGKPPGVYFHAHKISTSPGDGGLVFDDPCGGVDSPGRFCNMYGKVVTSGDHDAAEKDAGAFQSNTQERMRWLASPTINLKSSGNGGTFYNAMGIDDEIALTTRDYRVLFSLYNAGFVNATTETGQFFQAGYQSWPARQPNGARCWGETRHTGGISFYGPPRACFETFFTNAKASQLIRRDITGVAAGIRRVTPDSLRLYIHRVSRCYTFTNLVEATCAPTVGVNVGTYFDNISVALQDGLPPPGLAISIWNLINDAFPINPSAGLIPSAFDTCGAEVRIGLNVAAQIGSTLRPAIAGDSVIVTAGGDGKRVDMVFRILPGPGNYVTTGTKASGVARRPDGKNSAGTFIGKVQATPGDGTFFGEYMNNTGAFGSQTQHPSGGTVWSQHVWNSARMDTIENNLFPTKDNGSVIGLTSGLYAGMYNELDPKFSTLGISKNRCYKVVPNGQNNDANIVCIGAMSAVTYPASSGWDGTQTTKEYTKIIPDGLLTPGSHVQYFFRKSDDPSGTTSIEIGPDTSLILPQASEDNRDGHRWQQFGVLPDRWKDGAWPVSDRNAAAPACLLYVDWCDRRSPERLWVGVADTIGATVGSYSGGMPTGRWGAHNGWHARGDQEYFNIAIATDPTIAVYAHGGQPGTIWDMFGVKASESSTTSPSFGSRAAASAFGQQIGKENQTGPTGDMLRNYYRIVMSMTGDLNAGNIGPYADKSDDDVGLLNDFLKTAGGTPKPRGLWMGGEGFVEGQILGEAGTAHPAFMNAVFSVTLAGPIYREYAANTTDIVDLTSTGWTTTPAGAIWGVANDCFQTDDVLTPTGTGVVRVKYPDTGTQANPKAASVFTADGGGHQGLTLVDGFDVRVMGTRNTLTSYGTNNYFSNVITNLFGSLNCVLSAAGPVSVGENPNNALVYFLALRSENPFRSGAAKITFGITHKEKVELKVYDVAGRLVKTLANREFTAGSHDLFWDGSSDDGRLVPRGVYFYQLRTPSFVSQKKLAVLKD